MQRWMEFIQSRNSRFHADEAESGPNFADWLAPDEHTNKDLLATAYWALIANMMSQMAHAVGKEGWTPNTSDDVVENHSARRFRRLTSRMTERWERERRLPTWSRSTPRWLPKLARAGARRKTRKRHRSTQLASFDRIPGHALPAVHARRSRALRCRVSPVAKRYLPILGLHAIERRDHVVGTLERRHRRSRHELLQPLCIRLGDRLGFTAMRLGSTRRSMRPGFKEIVDASASGCAHDLPARVEYDSIYGKIISDWKGTAAGPFSLRVNIPANSSARVFLLAIAGSESHRGGKSGGSAQAEKRILRGPTSVREPTTSR